MKNGSISRRHFVGRTAAGLAGTSVLSLMAPHRAAAFESSGDVPSPRRPGSAALAASYDLSPEITYLNHASIGTVPRVVRQALVGYLQVCETNPWLYLWGDAWDEPVARTRSKAAVLLHCDPAELAITHTTTEGFNTLASGLDLAAGDEVLFSSLNHVGASACWFHQARRRGFSVRRFEIPIEQVAGLSADDVVTLHVDQIRERTRVLVLPHVDNLVGLQHPVRRIASRARARGVRFIAVDGAQSVGTIPVDLSELGIDFYATSAHKWLQAPKGMGLLYVRRSIQEKLQPMSVTWGQPLWEGSARIYEDFGTRDLATVLALGDAIDFHRSLDRTAGGAHLRALRLRCRDRAAATAGVTWLSPPAEALSASLYTIGVTGPAKSLFERMFSRSGFVFRPFETSHGNRLRLSPNLATTPEDIDRFFDALEQAMG
ncbi:MAG: aminotransferase class V-fold PLP-dependent enzyme [Acidobacteriota bacterium]